MSWKSKSRNCASVSRWPKAWAGPKRSRASTPAVKLDAPALAGRAGRSRSFREVGKIAASRRYGPDGERCSTFAASNFLFGRGISRAARDPWPTISRCGAGGRCPIHRKFTQRSEAMGPSLNPADPHDRRHRRWRLGADAGVTWLFTWYVPAASGWAGTGVIREPDTVPVVALALADRRALARRGGGQPSLVMVKGSRSQLFAAGPAVVEAIGAETRKSLAAAAVHTRNGVVERKWRARLRPLRRRRRFLSHPPATSAGWPWRTAPTDPTGPARANCFDLVPRDARQVYSMRRLSMVCDKGSAFEMGGGMWGRAAITAFARFRWLAGRGTGQRPIPSGGSWEARTAEKVERFIKLADQFRLPVGIWWITWLQLIGQAAEAAGTIRYGVQAMNGSPCASVPLPARVIRRAYGHCRLGDEQYAEMFQYRFRLALGRLG